MKLLTSLATTTRATILAAALVTAAHADGAEFYMPARYFEEAMPPQGGSTLEDLSPSGFVKVTYQVDNRPGATQHVYPRGDRTQDPVVMGPILETGDALRIYLAVLSLLDAPPYDVVSEDNRITGLTSRGEEARMAPGAEVGRFSGNNWRNHHYGRVVLLEAQVSPDEVGDVTWIGRRDGEEVFTPASVEWQANNPDGPAGPDVLPADFLGGDVDCPCALDDCTEEITPNGYCSTHAENHCPEPVDATDNVSATATCACGSHDVPAVEGSTFCADHADGCDEEPAAAACPCEGPHDSVSPHDAPYCRSHENGCPEEAEPTDGAPASPEGWNERRPIIAGDTLGAIAKDLQQALIDAGVGNPPPIWGDGGLVRQLELHNLEEENPGLRTANLIFAGADLLVPTCETLYPDSDHCKTN